MIRLDLIRLAVDHAKTYSGISIHAESCCENSFVAGYLAGRDAAADLARHEVLISHAEGAHDLLLKIKKLGVE